MKKNNGFTLYSRREQGFTLIELLTVIAIIAILTGLFTVSYLTVRQRGRDAQRKSDIKQIQSALELYRSDNDSYPDNATFQALTCGQSFSSASGVKYMNKLPCDPSGTVSSPVPYYYYQVSSTSYVVASCLESTNDKDGVSGASAPPSWWGSPVWPPPTACSSNFYYLSSNP